MKKVLFVLTVLCIFMLQFLCISNAVQDVGINPKLYYKLQMRENVPETAGISEEDLLRLDKWLALCLIVDDADVLRSEWVDGEEVPLTVEVHGVRQPAFNEREISHMQDCADLFFWLNEVDMACLWAIFGLAAIASSIYVLDDKIREGTHGLWKAYWIASGAIFIPLVVLGVWAAIDFNSAFDFFHRILFTNDLWLLNPETDLLINICPPSMFVNMGLRIAFRSFAVLFGFPLLLTIITRIAERRKKVSPDA